jgi:hypothetical protein
MRSRKPHTSSSEAEAVFPTVRRLYALVALGLGIALWVFWAWRIVPLEGMPPGRGRGGLIVLGLLSAVLAMATARRFHARYRLSATGLTGRDLGWTGPRSIDLAYSEIRGIGFSRVGVIPDLIVWRHEGPALRLPGLMFSGSRDFVDQLRQRVARAQGPAPDALLLPARFRRRALSFLLPAISVFSGGVWVFQVLQSGVWPGAWEGVWLVLLLGYVPLCALLGLSPFVSYRGEGRRIRRLVWLRPSLSGTIDLDRASSYGISSGRMPRLQLFTRGGGKLASLELSDFDFDDVVLWAEKHLRKSP